jgi:hypothetical protein
MLRQLIFTSFFLFILGINLFASDTTKYHISITAGLTNNSVYGTMVNRNNQFGTNVKMENKVGFSAGINIDKSITSRLFIRTGLNFIFKQVNPMVNTIAIYKDELKTGYLSIPVELGVNVIPFDKIVNLSFTVGTMTNFRLIEKSKIGPDRADFKTPFVSESISAGARICINASSKSKFVLQYNYLYDISNSYVESLYYLAGGSTTKFNYKYKTSLISMGLQFAFKK